MHTPHSEHQGILNWYLFQLFQCWKCHVCLYRDLSSSSSQYSRSQYFRDTLGTLSGILWINSCLSYSVESLKVSGSTAVLVVLVLVWEMVSHLHGIKMNYPTRFKSGWKIVSMYADSNYWSMMIWVSLKGWPQVCVVGIEWWSAAKFTVMVGHGDSILRCDNKDGDDGEAQW